MNIQEFKNKMESWSVSTKSKNFSFILTVFIWLVIFISLLVIKPIQKEPKYKEIQIVLDSVKKIEKKACIEKSNSYIRLHNSLEFVPIV